jgi:hypothetical protein
MKRQAQPKTAASIQLFPFLAVLLCTMGALLILLVIIAQQAREQAARELSENPGLTEELETKISDAQWRLDQLKVSRDKTAEQLAEARAGVSHIEEHARRLAEELAEAERAAAEILRTANSEREDTAKLKAEAAKLAEKLKEAEKELEEARKKAKTRKQSYAIIPFEGPNKTNRRPIYIECRSDAVVLQPEGIRLTEEDFPLSASASSPLAAALRAAREYLVRNRMAGIGEDGEPYPLLLVRPDGIEAYIAARTSMAGWSADFGYEFIEKDWPLEFPPPDPNMSQAMAQAINEARLRQAALALAAPRLVTPEDRISYRSRGGGGGGGSGNDGGGRGGFAKGQGRGPGGSGARPVSLSSGGGGSYAARHASATSGGRDTTGRSPYDSLPDSPGTTGGGAGLAGTYGNAPYLTPNGTGLNGGGGAYGAGGGMGVGGNGQPGPGGNGQAGANGQIAGNGTGTGTAGPVFPGNGQPGQAGYNGPGGGPGGNAAAGNGSPGSGGTGGGGNGQYASGQGGNGQGGSGQPGGTQGKGGNGQPGSSGQSGGSVSPFATASGGGAGGSGAGTGGSGGSGGAAGGGASGMSSGGGVPMPMSSGSTANIQMGQRPGDPSSFNTPGRTYSQSGSGKGNASSAPDGSQASGSSSPGGQQGQPAQNGQQQPPNVEVQSLAKSRGKNWSLPEEVRHQTPVSRPIRLECRGDRLTLLAEPGDRRGNKVIAMPGSTVQAVDPLVKSITERIENWGLAGNNMYWRPILVVNVAPDGAGRYEDLRTLLHDSGLDIRQKGAK